MGEFEQGVADVIVQHAVAEQFVQRDAPVAGDADRIFLIVGVGQREDRIVDAGAGLVAGAMGVDLVAARRFLSKWPRWSTRLGNVVPGK